MRFRERENSVGLIMIFPEEYQLSELHETNHDPFKYRLLPLILGEEIDD